MATALGIMQNLLSETLLIYFSFDLILKNYQFKYFFLIEFGRNGGAHETFAYNNGEQNSSVIYETQNVDHFKYQIAPKIIFDIITF